ncbi:MAG TPA: hypothetical protein VH080_08355 [Gemmatimonadaceae bacterium]|nr:hypothetical protein [Gemmatimonadaceae bacterium]
MTLALQEPWPTARGKMPNEHDQAQMASTAEVKAVVEGVQRRHRGRIKWGIGRHTAELALRALHEPRAVLRRPSSSKSRRRKRHKRLL